MKDTEKKFYTEYLADIDRRGMRRKHVQYSLKIFFTYLNETGRDLLRLRLNHAQDFQVYLTTSTTYDGSMRFTRASVLNIVGGVSGFYEFLRRRKYIHANPFKELDRVRRSDALPRNILNEENMDVFLKHLKNFMQGRTLTEKRKLYRAHVLGELMYSTGARINEVASLTPADCDFDRSVITLRDSKTGKTREAILNSFAEKVLSIYLGLPDFVWLLIVFTRFRHKIKPSKMKQYSHPESLSTSKATGFFLDPLDSCVFRFRNSI